GAEAGRPVPAPWASPTAIGAVGSSSRVPMARVFSVIADGSITARLGTCRGSSAGIGMVIGLLGSRSGARQDSPDRLRQVHGDVERDQGSQDRKSTRLKLQSRFGIVCR